MKPRLGIRRLKHLIPLPPVFFPGGMPANAGAPPNILVILADDLGDGDVACYNPETGILSSSCSRKMATFSAAVKCRRCCVMGQSSS